jgi:hypothetical protein
MTELGYQLLRSTQQQPATTPVGNQRAPRQFALDQGNNLEQNLLATIAANDPKVAYQKTIESLDKGEFPTALNRVLTQLQTKEPDLFKKFTDKTLNRLASDSLLASREATGVAVNLLLPGPRITNTAGADQTNATSANANAPANTNVRGGSPVLSETAYHDLMEQAISAALSVTSMGQTATRSAAAVQPESCAAHSSSNNRRVRRTRRRFGRTTLARFCFRYRECCRKSINTTPNARRQCGRN